MHVNAVQKKADFCNDRMDLVTNGLGNKGEPECVIVP